MKSEVRLTSQWYLTPLLQVALLAAVTTWPSAAQGQQSEDQFIAATSSAIAAFQNTLPVASHKVVLSANLLYANGAIITQPAITVDVLLKFVEGLKAAGAQRVDLNPAVTSIEDPAATAIYDALVLHIRELGMQLALNPQVVGGELGASATFQDFQSKAMSTYAALAARYQPDNFVIVHEPTTMNARLGGGGTPQDWDNFIRAVAPVIRTASPHTRLGAGGFYDAAENIYFEDFVTIPVLDFMTIDIYDYNNFSGLNGWVQLAHAAVESTHPNGKGIYIEETWAPKFLPNPLPPGWQSLPGGLDSIALVGSCDVAFKDMNTAWLQAMLQWASASGMEAVTPFTTSAFFFYGTAGHDKAFDPTYVTDALSAIQNGQLTDTGSAYRSFNSQFATPQVTSISSASYATLPSVFTPSCPQNPGACMAQTVVAPDNLVSAFGADLATANLVDGSFPTSLGGTTATLVDSSNSSYPVPLYAVTPGQVNYVVPADVKLGPATLTVTSGDGTVTSGTVLVSQVMPGLYTANQNGQGAPAAIAIIAHADKSQSSELTFTCSSGASCVPAPLRPAATDSLYIELFGTGIRHVSGLSAVSATVNGQSVPVQYAGASGYIGEDQVNIQIPQSLFHSGTVNLVLTVGGQTSNTVTLDLE